MREENGKKKRGRKGEGKGRKGRKGKIKNLLGCCLVDFPLEEDSDWSLGRTVSCWSWWIVVVVDVVVVVVVPRFERSFRGWSLSNFMRMKSPPSPLKNKKNK